MVNLIAENRRARFDYFLEETFEAGQAPGTKFLEVCGRSYI